ncbi:MAG: Y-family DNA polymerase [Leptonema sp. (in: bacteria)]
MLFIPREDKIFGIIDANNFYVSCEQAFNPKIKNTPAIVLSNNDGCVISRSPEAKKLGIKMGEPFFKIKDKVEKYKIHVFSSNFPLYADMSYRFYETLSVFFPEVEIYSVDECFLDLTSLRKFDLQSYLEYVREEIYKWIKIPTCIGVGRTKTIAKLANKYAKSNKIYKGVYIALEQTQIEKLLKKNKIEDVWGIGKKTAKFLKRNNIYTPYDLIQQNKYWIRKKMKINGLKTNYELQGISCIDMDINPNRKKKNITISRSFSEPITEIEEIENILLNFCVKLSEKLNSYRQVASYIGLYLRSNPFNKREKYYSNYGIIKLESPTNSFHILKEKSFQSLKKIYKENIKYKKMGLFGINLQEETSSKQLDFFNSLPSPKTRSYTNLIVNLMKFYNRSDKKKILFAKNLIYKTQNKLENKIFLTKKYTMNIWEIPEVHIK